MTLPLSDLAANFRAALHDAGHHASREPLRDETGRYTNSTAAFDRFARLAGAPDVLAVIDAYAGLTSLGEDEGFSASCLPQNNRIGPAWARASAVSVGMVEVLMVDVERTSGEVSAVTVYTEPGVDLGPAAEHPDVEIALSDLDGGGHRLTCARLDTVEWLLTDGRVAPLLVDRVAAMRHRMRRHRRRDWHNSWLWALIERGVALPASTRSEEYEGPEKAPDVSSADVWRLARARTSQRRFRQLLLAHQPTRCAYCGLDFDGVLDAAHLTAHSQGGSASLDNGRLLCATHHRAFDLGLLRWTGSEFVWVREDIEPF